MIYDDLPADPGIVYDRAGIRESATVETQWTMNRDWVLASATPADWNGLQQGNQPLAQRLPQPKNTNELFVQGIGSFSAAHLMAIVDE